jgi:dihydrofolate reductase
MSTYDEVFLAWAHSMPVPSNTVLAEGEDQVEDSSIAVALIAAMDPSGVIGIDGKMPWKYPADFRRFKQVTMGGVLVMGSKTFRSLPGLLHGRTHFVVSRGDMRADKVQPDLVCESLESAILTAENIADTHAIWIAGGAHIYRLALEGRRVDFIDLTIVPPVDIPPGASVTRFPTDLLSDWEMVRESALTDDPRLRVQRYEHRP